MSFGKAFFSSCLGALAALVVFCILSFIIFAGLISGLTSEKEVVVKNNSVLHLKLDAEISELEDESPLSGLPMPGGDIRNIGLLQ
jgi:protease IV